MKSGLGDVRHEPGPTMRCPFDLSPDLLPIPTENSRDYGTLPAEVLDKLRIEFYSEPSQAAFKGAGRVRE
jgi:ATP-dependent Lon protease